MAQPKMSPVPYKRAATDVVPEADVYTKATEATKTSTFKAIDKLGSKIGDQVNFQKSGDFWKDVSTNFNSTAKQLTQYFDATGEGLKFNTDRLKSELGTQFGNYSFLNDLTDGQLDSLGGYMDGGSLQVMYGTVKGVLENGTDGLNASSILSGANSLLGGLGTISLINNSALFGLASLVLDFVESTGMASLFDDILSKIEDEKTLNELLEQRAIGAAGESDIPLCRHYVDSMGYSRANAIRTDIIPMIMQSYELKPDDTRSYQARATEVVALLGAIDTNWHTSGARRSTHYFHGMSDDAIRVFSTLEPTGLTRELGALAIGCAGLAGEMDAMSLATSILGVPLSE